MKRSYTDIGAIISEADAKAEGCRCNKNTIAETGFATYRDAYRSLREQINGPGSWDANPWVWVVEVRAAAAISTGEPK